MTRSEPHARAKRATGRTLIAVSVGCPCRLGPEASVVAALAARASVLLVGDRGAVDRAARGRGIDSRRIVRVDDPSSAWSVGRGRVALWQPTESLRARDRRAGHPTPASGAA